MGNTTKHRRKRPRQTSISRHLDCISGCAARRPTEDDDVVQEVEGSPRVDHGTSVATGAGEARIPAFRNGRAVKQGAADGHDAADDEPRDEKVDDGPGRVRLEDSVCLARNG